MFIAGAELSAGTQFALGFGLAISNPKLRGAASVIGGTLIAEYTYDRNGKRTSRSGAGATRTGTYDAQDRVGPFGSRSYAFNDYLRNPTMMI